MSKSHHHKLTRSRTAIVVAATTLMLAGTGLAQVNFSTPINISNDYGRFAVDADSAVDSNGYVHVVYTDFWFDNTGGAYYVTNVGGTWSTPVRLQAHNGKGTGPKIRIDSSDNLHVIIGKGQVYYTTKPAASGSWSSLVRLDTSPGPEGGFCAATAIDSNDGLMVAYYVLFKDSYNPRSALWTRYKPSGGAWGNPKLVFGTNDEHQWPQGGYLNVAPNDTFYAAYSWGDDHHFKTTTGGNNWGGQNTLPRPIRMERLAWDPTSNEMAAVYIHDIDGDADKFWIECFAAFSYDGGYNWTTPFNISNGRGLDRAPRVAYDQNGNLHTVWEAFTCDGCTPRMKYRARIAGAWYAISSTSFGIPSFPSHTTLMPEANDLHVVYTRDLGEPEIYDTFYTLGDLSVIPTDVGTLSGYVRDQHGQGVLDATVQAAGAGVTNTDSNGYYSLPLVVGTYDVTATKAYYAGQTLSGISIAKDQTVTRDFTITALPPDSVYGFTANPLDGAVRLSWNNPDSGNYYATRVIYRTDRYPTSATDGTLVTEWVGDGGRRVGHDHTGLSNGTTYYYAAFSRDNQTYVHYADPDLAQATPVAAPVPDKLSNGDLDTYTNGVADNWTSYTVNDPSNGLNFQSESDFFLTDKPPAQRINDLNSYSLPSTGLTAAGIRQVVSGLTVGKVYQLTGWQDVYVSDYKADSRRYLLNFGINTTGGTSPGTPNWEGSIGGAKWMTDEQVLFNNNGGGTVYYSGYHRSFAAYPAEATSVSVWSGLTIDNTAPRDNNTSRYYTDSLKLLEWDFSAQSSLTNGDFEGSAIDTQTAGLQAANGDLIPSGWVPAGGGVGQWCDLRVDTGAAYSGSYGFRVGHRRGTVNGGIMQKITVTSGQFVTFSAIARTSGSNSTQVGIGIDPTGGGDITSSDVIWHRSFDKNWQTLEVSSIVPGTECTVFIKSESKERWGTGGYHWINADNCTLTVEDPPDPGTVAGTVTDKCGNPISGATVDVTSAFLDDHQTTTAANGTYTINDVFIGSYTVTISKSGYDDYVEYIDVLENQTTTVSPEMLDSQRGIIAGTLIDDCGDPVVGATVATTTECYSATTGSDGSYLILDVPTGTWSVAATASGFNQNTQTGVTVSDDTTTTVDFTMVPAALGTISGTVTDQCGDPLQGITVSTDPGCYSTTTASDGTYTLSNVRGGTFTVNAIETLFEPGQQAGVVVTDQQTTTVNFQLQGESESEFQANGDFEGGFFGFWGGDMPNNWGATWRGSFEDADWDDVVWGGDHGHVLLMKNLEPGFEAGITQAVGGLTPGKTYRISAEAYQDNTETTAWIGVDLAGGTTLPARTNQFPNVTGQWNSIELEGTVGASGSIRVFLWAYRGSGALSNVYFDNVRIREVSLVPAQAKIAGVVRDNNDQPIEGASITTDTGGYGATTASDGTYLIEDVTPSTYQVCVDAIGYVDECVSGISATECDTASVNFSLDPPSGTQVVVNGDFESGFFNFWGGRIGNSWGAVYDSPFSDNDQWQELDVGGSHGKVQRLRDLDSGGGKVAIIEQITGLTPSDSYTMLADVYQFGSGTTAWMTADPDGGTSIPSSGTQFPTTLNQWVTQEVTGTVGSGGTVSVFVWAHRTGTASDVYIDNVRLYVGSTGPTTGTISGVVLDDQGNPLEGATVSTDTGGYSTTSAANGAYTLADVAAGTYDVTASKTDYDNETVTSVSVTAGQTTTVDFSLDLSNQLPVRESLTLSDDVLVADNATTYTVTAVASDVNGVDDIKAMRWLINEQGDNAGSHRGYVSWGATSADIGIFGGESNWTINAVSSGSGYWGIRMNGWGKDDYITMVSADESSSGNTRTVVFTFKVKSKWYTDGPLTNNDISYLIHDASGHTGWANYDLSFGITDATLAVEAVSLSTTPLVADGQTQYSVTYTASDVNGVGEIRDMRVMFNIDTGDSSKARGYLAWGLAQSDITLYGGTWDIEAASGTGYCGFESADWGYQYITPVACTTTTDGNNRTVTWTFTVDPLWASVGPQSGNFIGMWVRNGTSNLGWQTSDNVFGYTFGVTFGDFVGDEKLSNGDFESGFFGFWGGDMPNSWGAQWATPFSDNDQWQDHNFGGANGMVSRIRNVQSGGKIAILQQVSGLDAGADFAFEAEAYQLGTGTTAWIAVDPDGGTTLPSGTQFNNVASQWNTQQIRGTVGTGGTVTVFLFAYNESSQSDVYFDNASLKVAPKEPGSISGFVRDASNNPISGATVSTDTGGYSTTSSTDGSYTLSDVTPGSYDVTASATGYFPLTNSATVAEGQNVAIDFNLGEVTGTEELSNGDFESGFFSFWGGDMPNSWGATWATPFSDNDQWQDHNFGGANGMVMRIRNVQSGGQIAIVQQVSGLTAGSTYSFSAEAYQLGAGTTAWIATDPDGGTTIPTSGAAFGGGTSSWQSQMVSGTVGSGGTVSVFLYAYNESGQADVYFDNASLLVDSPDPGSITGLVLDANSLPLSGATVETDTGGYSTTSASDGSYTLSNVSPGTYAVTASLSGYYDSSTSGVAVSEGAATTVDFNLDEIAGTEALVNGDFESGFFGFWGGDIGNDWGAVWRGSFDSATWDDEYVGGGDYEYVMELKSLASGFEAGVVQVATGLTPGASFAFTAEAYQLGTGTTAWIGVDADGGTALPAAEVPFPNVAGQWNEVTVTGTVGSGGSVSVFLWADRSGTSSAVYFDNASLLVD